MRREDEQVVIVPEAAVAPVHWPQPLELPEAVALKARHEIPESFVCPLTMGVMRQPAITPRGTTYEFEALVRWIDSRGRYPAGEAGALYRDELAPNLALRNLIEAWVNEQTPPPPPPAPAPAPAPVSGRTRALARTHSLAPFRGPASDAARKFVPHRPCQLLVAQAPAARPSRSPARRRSRA